MLEHLHKDKYECVLLNGGTRVLTAGGLPYTVYPENAFFTHPDEPHAADRATKDAGEMLWFQINAQGPLLSLDRGGTALFAKPSLIMQSTDVLRDAGSVCDVPRKLSAFVPEAALLPP